jgi:hypothetical protein
MVQIVHERSALRAAAYREAGYTAAAQDYGLRIRTVSISSPSDSLGASYLQSLSSLDLSLPLSPAARDLLEKRLLMALSGPAAEHWLRCRPAVGEDSTYEGHLIEVVLRLHRSSSVARAYAEYLRAQVESWLTLPETQRAINTIATALVARKTLPGEQARNLWREAKLHRECRRPEPIPFPREHLPRSGSGS